VSQFKEFKGRCMGVRLTPRGEDDPHILYEFIVEDDENWYEKVGGSSSSWLDEQMSVLQEAKDWLSRNADPDMCEISPGNVRQFGWKFRP
jgi:hypothetical protein